MLLQAMTNKLQRRNIFQPCQTHVEIEEFGQVYVMMTLKSKLNFK